MIDRFLESNFDGSSGPRRPAKSFLPMLLIALMAPVLAPRAGQAQLLFQPVAGCDGTNPTTTYQGVVVNCPVVLTPNQLRVQAYVKKLVTRWMDERQLPAADLQVIETFGRSDLLGDINAYIAADIMRVLEEDPASRTAEEQFVLSTFAEDFRVAELALYDHAVKDGDSFVKDPCHWKPDPEVAAAYGLSYDPTPYCRANASPFVGLLTFHIPGPKPEYLTAAAFKAVYGQGGAAVASAMQGKLAKHLVGASTALVAGGIAGGIAAANLSTILPFATAVSEEATVAEIASAAANGLRLTRLLAGGSFTIITLMIEVGIESIIAFDDEVKFQQGLDNLRATRDRLQSTGQDTLTAVTGDQGLIKSMILINNYGVGSLGNGIPQYRSGIDRVFIVNNVSPAESLALTDFSGQQWNVHMLGNWFVRSTTDSAGQKYESITADLEVLDDHAIKWIATRIGQDRFRMTQVNPPESATVCATVNGISTRRDGSCTVYYTDTINITQLPSGAKLSIGLGIAPKIVSRTFFFPAHARTSFNVDVSGLPAPAVQFLSLPAWLHASNGTLSGDPGDLFGSIQVPVRVRTQSGADDEQLTIYYGVPVQFTSPSVVEVVATKPVQFTINTAGTPRPAITQTGWLPYFLTFKDNGNGTATLSGLWSSSIKPFCIVQCDLPAITATNGVQTVSQPLSFQYTFAPRAVFNGPAELKFVAGVRGQYLLTTTGAQTRVTWDDKIALFTDLRSQVMQQLPWLRVQENSDGTVLLDGTPPMTGQPVSLSVTACPFADGSGIRTCSSGNLRITVDAAARFMSDPFGGVVTGRPPRIQMTVNRLNGSIRFTDQLPNGLSIVPAPPQPDGKVTAQIQGTPAPGQGGRYQLNLNWTDQATSLNELFKLDILEPATITSPPSFTFFEGMPATGQVTTRGYPVNSAGIDCGIGKDCGDMQISLRWGTRPIAGLTLTDHSPQGVPTGFGQFAGTIPTGSSAVYPATLQVSNGRMAPPFQQAVRLVVLPNPDLNGDGVVDCQDLAAIKNAIGTVPPGLGRGFDVNGDGVVDQKDIDAMVRAVSSLCTCTI